MRISDSMHPQYVSMLTKWEKFRDIATSGQDFVDKYVERFSKRETNAEFAIRKRITSCPAFAKSAIKEIKNMLYRSMVDIVRSGGSETYHSAVVSGVTKQGHSMNSFIGQLVIYEMLTMGKVGVFVDRDPFPEDSTRAEMIGKNPYFYVYKAEDIQSWNVNDYGELTTLLLRDHIYKTNDFGLPTVPVTRYRLLKLTPDGVVIEFYDDNSILTESRLLNLPQIPFVMFELPESLLTDIAGYQIALLNLGSSDMNLAQSNFPFITEQVHPQVSMNHIDNPDDIPLDDDFPANHSVTSSATDDQKAEIVGPSYGRQYAKGLERPGFIHPSSEPLLASLQKQSNLQEEIRQMVNLAVAAVEKRRESAESKQMDRSGKEEGLAAIAQELEHGEQKLAEIWAAYEGSDKVALIKYPSDYAIRTDADRRVEAKELSDMLPKIPSLTFQKKMAKRVVSIMLEPYSASEEINKSFAEIDKAKVIVIDPDVVQQDFESGFVGVDLASKMRGYPDGEAEKAKKDHEERALRVAMAQSKAAVASGGNTDPDRQDQDTSDPKQRKEDKQQQLDKAKQDRISPSKSGSNKDLGNTE